jgi:branched-chain amino acid transport system substrate-binding protein
MNTRRAILTAGVLSAMTLAGLTAHAADKPPIKIGVIVPLSGFQTAYGEMYRTTFAMVVEDINKAGGVYGSPIELVVDDDQGRAEQAVTLFRRHVSDGVFAELGPIAGTTWEQVAPLANSMNTPALNWTALKPGITKKPYALRIHPAADLMIPEGVAEFRKKFPAVKKVVIAGDLKEASGASGIEQFRKAAPNNGFEVVEEVGFDTRTTDFSPVAIKIRGIAPDAIFVSAFSPNVLALVKELEAQGLSKPILGNALIWAGAFPQAAGAAGRNVHSIGFNTNESAPEIKGHDDFAVRYVKFAIEKTKQLQPINVANTTLARDALMLLIGILRDRKIDGTTNVQKARDSIKDGLAATKQWDGLNKITILDSGDGYITSHLIEVDVANKSWKYSLPPDQRLKK